MGKKGSKKRWDKIHSEVRLSNKFSKEKIAIMAYLSGDGYITVRKKYFHYDTQLFLDDLFLAERAVKLFKKEFNVIPKIRPVKSTIGKPFGFYKIEISNKPLCLHLLSLSKYNGLNWSMPKFISDSLKIEWIKCFFDCEAHVKFKRPQIQVKSVNENGLKEVGIFLNENGIKNKVYGPYNNGENHNPYFMLSIYTMRDIILYRKKIGFYHSKKKQALEKF
jgi:hypothetical protein